MELADMTDLKFVAERRVGSRPAFARSILITLKKKERK